MKRVSIEPRGNYVSKIQDIGFLFSEEYWLESGYYEFSKGEIDSIETASNECYQMYCSATQHIIDNNLWDKLHIPKHVVPHLVESWDRDNLSLYGRFDFIMVDGTPKLLEFNADTPTTLLEASIVQWQWKEELFPNHDQFNSIHESLIESWKCISDTLEIKEQVHFMCLQDSLEDESTTLYLAATANEAGIDSSVFDVSELVYNHEDGKFYTPDEQTKINYLFKLYPYEWMFEEEFGIYLNCENITLFEPLWKAIMSNKYILNIIAELFPDSPYVLKCGEEVHQSGSYCKKPIFSREGSNVSLVKNSNIIEESEGEYGQEGYIYQELIEADSYEGMYPVIGSWIIGGEACGIGIRETSSRITHDMATFAPHIISK